MKKEVAFSKIKSIMTRVNPITSDVKVIPPAKRKARGITIPAVPTACAGVLPRITKPPGSRGIGYVFGQVHPPPPNLKERRDVDHRILQQWDQLLAKLRGQLNPRTYKKLHENGRISVEGNEVILWSEIAPDEIFTAKAAFSDRLRHVVMVKNSLEVSHSCKRHGYPNPEEGPIAVLPLSFLPEQLIDPQLEERRQKMAEKLLPGGARYLDDQLLEKECERLFEEHGEMLYPLLHNFLNALGDIPFPQKPTFATLTAFHRDINRVFAASFEKIPEWQDPLVELPKYQEELLEEKPPYVQALCRALRPANALLLYHFEPQQLETTHWALVDICSLQLTYFLDALESGVTLEGLQELLVRSTKAFFDARNA